MIACENPNQQVTQNNESIPLERPFEMFLADGPSIYMAQANDWQINEAFEIDQLDGIRALTTHEHRIGIAPTSPQDKVIIYDRNQDTITALQHY